MTKMSNTVVISGASRGLGFCLARLHAEKGDHVHMIIRKENDQVRDLLRKHTNCVIHIGDVSRTAAVATALQEICAAIEHIDILYNVAAIFREADRKGIRDTDIDSMHEMFDINACGALRVLQGLDSRIDTATHIINVSSESGSCTSTLETGLYAYSMAKAALNLATVVYAKEMNRGRNIIAVDPGWMRTDMGGPKAQVDPNESAQCIMKLAEKMDQLNPECMFFKYTGRELAW